MSELIVANWKSNKTVSEAQAWLDEVEAGLSLQLSTHAQQAELVIAPPFPLLPVVMAHPFVQKHPQVKVGIQDVSPFPAGSYTGAVAAYNVAELGVKYVIVGHSERRRHFHETHQDVANKVRECLENNLTPIVCVDADYVTAQVQAIESQYRSRCVVAYEPLAAIGSGDNVDAQYVQPILEKINQEFETNRIIYGGSVNGDNIAEYVLTTAGVLVGTASLEPAKFMAVVSKVLQFN